MVRKAEQGFTLHVIIENSEKKKVMFTCTAIHIKFANPPCFVFKICFPVDATYCENCGRLFFRGKAQTFNRGDSKNSI